MALDEVRWPELLGTPATRGKEAIRIEAIESPLFSFEEPVGSLRSLIIG